MSRRLDPLLTDLDRLTAPISTENPCGAWLRYDVTYDEVRDARREDDAGLPQGVWASELKRANWATVEKLCAEALSGRTKDLQLAAWLMEAWIQLDGFAGAARGFELMRRLCSTFWDGMYPALDNDPAPRLAPIQWGQREALPAHPPGPAHSARHGRHASLFAGRLGCSHAQPRRHRRNRWRLDRPV